MRTHRGLDAGHRPVASNRGAASARDESGSRPATAPGQDLTNPDDPLFPSVTIAFPPLDAPPPAAAPDGKDGNGEKKDSDKKGGDGDKKDSDKKDDDKKDKDKKDDDKDKKDEAACRGFFGTLVKAYCDEFFPKEDAKKKPEEPEPERRANPAPFIAPPFPTAEWQGYPNIGVPPTDYGTYPLMKAIYSTPWGDAIKDSRNYVYGWVTGSFNDSSSKMANTPDSYAIVPNRLEMEQAVLRFEREPDTVQTSSIDWGYRITNLYGIDYRYTAAGGDFSDQLLKNNRLYGWDPLEYYGDLYIPGIADGLSIRLGRYISPPDIEAQLCRTTTWRPTRSCSRTTITPRPASCSP